MLDETEQGCLNRYCALLAGGLFHGDAGDGSVLAVLLTGGALLGAAGGALSASGSERGAPPS